MEKKIEYVKYLDKEMTIMGVLSAFSVSAAAAVLWKVTEGKKDSLLWRMEADAPCLTFGGTGLVLAAAFHFYRQRSLLAFYYGQIVLANNYPKLVRDKVAQLHEDADSWATWLLYRWAFMFLLLGFVSWSGALLLGRFNRGERGWPLIGYGILATLSVGAMVRIHIILNRHANDHDDPLERFVGAILGLPGAIEPTEIGTKGSPEAPGVEGEPACDAAADGQAPPT